MTPGSDGSWPHGGSGRLRVSDADRDGVAEDLREHHAEGRLDVAELGERLDATFAAKTRDELSAVTLDLPDRSPGRSGPRPDWSDGPRREGRGGRVAARSAGHPDRRRFRHPLLALLVGWLVLSGVGHAMGAALGYGPHGPGAFPLLFLVAALFLVLRRRGRSRRAGADHQRRGVTGSGGAGSVRTR